MSDVDAVADTEPTSNPAFRFGVSTLMVLTVLVGIIATFLRPYGDRVFIAAGITVLAAIAIGFLIGMLRQRIAECVFWSVVAAAIIQVITANVLLLHTTGIYAWPIIAAITASVIVVMPSRLLLRMGVGNVVAAIAYAGYVAAIPESIATMKSELVCAPIGGALLAVLIAACDWTERRFKIPSIYVAFTLVVLAVATAALGKHYIPNW